MIPENSRTQFLSRERLSRLLESVHMPYRYIGGEYGAVIKHESEINEKVLLAFPDAYEIGMSYLGFRILYQILNETEGVLAERCFAPWPDMEQVLREEKVPLFSLETKRFLYGFDIIGFSLQYELSATNLLNMLDLGGIPVRSNDRRDEHPLVIAGGPVAVNPEPYSPFIDAFFIGDAEEGFLDAIDRHTSVKSSSGGRLEILKSLSEMDSVYVPQLTASKPDSLTGMFYRTKEDGTDLKIKRRIISNLARHPFPSEMVVPYGKAVQDKVSIELNRGCRWGCRFCQAGFVYLPERQRPVEQVKHAVKCAVAGTGYDEVSLTGLTPSDYNDLDVLVEDFRDISTEGKVSFSLSSIRMDKVSSQVIEMIGGVRRTGITLAPEAGTQRMRDVINKKLSERNIIETAKMIFSNGWRLMKLYFMIGLPTETGEDIKAIADLSHKIFQQGKGVKRLEINLGVSSFVPKPHTPFQWEAMNTLNEIREKQRLIRRSLRSRRIEFKSHEPKLTFLEGLLSRGDLRMADVIHKAWALGARFDGWSDFDNFGFWEQALDEAQIDVNGYLFDGLPLEARLPWDHIDIGVGKDRLISEREKAYRAVTSPGCPPEGCGRCEVCESLKNKEVASGQFDFVERENTSHSNSFFSEKKVERNPESHVAYYRKEGLYRYLSHFDVMRTMARALRRAGVSFAYTEGYHPKPKMSFPFPLPVGVSGREELFDFTVSAPLNGKNIVDKINSTLPDGLCICVLRPREGSKSVSSQVKSAVFSVGLKTGLAFKEAKNYYRKWDDLWRGSDPVTIKSGAGRDAKRRDARRLLKDINLREEDQRIVFELLYTSEGSMNPKSFLKKFFSDFVDLSDIYREKFLFS